MRMLNVMSAAALALWSATAAQNGRAGEDPHVMGCSSRQQGLHHPGEGLK